MGNATCNSAVHVGNGAPGVLGLIRARFEQYKTYRQTHRELSSLTDRALSDLGLSRSMIKSLAREAAYGA
ncbi:DUF1127 domain-containing protein [Tropicimonas isoalkanivorans]|uniref:Uncharacterized conserved protein YjiS, DUF1127 family n=1 Tax=Tropicimonas isoalkanivorans TaxID=441112 RepID=A0A1I1G6U3_9RHOB|nr:DUF1127 domain-containing protein [Tropicimonas isoalkanivorans]SFC07042.1 Uncharacterized conserved protein YjiS, DUF1127 family [Tropicimonas isoalkanivorans]